MVEHFAKAGIEGGASRYQAELENALLSIALAETTGDPLNRKALYANWLIGLFNATACGLTVLGAGYGALEWFPDGNGHQLVWNAPTGFVCPLARIYPQPDGTWASLVVAGVKDDLLDAMGAAEWAVSRLAA